MQPLTSILLDVVRFSAAIIVFLSHVTSREFNNVLPWVRWGHEAVAIFFVMSGFVIAYVLSNKEKNILSYAAARLGRLYSVVLPAIFLTLVLDSIGRAINPEVYSGISYDHTLLRLVINLLFLQQNWNLTVMPLSNGPFWSLGYEFWYYCIYGSWFLIKGRFRFLVTFLFSICAGPAILLFFPLWLVGVIAFNLYRFSIIAPLIRYFLLLLVLTSLVSILIYGNPLSCVQDFIKLTFPDGFLTIGHLKIYLGHVDRLPGDLLLGLLFGAFIILLRGSNVIQNFSGAIYSVIRWLAGSTFSIYLFHVPLLFFSYAYFKIDRNSPAEILGNALLVFVICILFSYLGERQVVFYRNIFYKILSHFQLKAL